MEDITIKKYPRTPHIRGSRYIMYGEWMYAKHAIYYDKLPHYFMEFDIFDRETGRFLQPS